MYSVTLSNLPWSARMIHIKIWSLRILKNTFCPLWELDGNQIMTSLGACSTYSCWPGTTWVLLCGWPLGSVPAAATLVMLGFPGHLRFFLEAVTSQRLSYQDGRLGLKKQQQECWWSWNHLKSSPTVSTHWLLFDDVLATQFLDVKGLACWLPSLSSRLKLTAIGYIDYIFDFHTECSDYSGLSLGSIDSGLFCSEYLNYH